MQYRVMVDTGKGPIVSYPARGFPLFSKPEAIEILLRMYSRCPWEDGGKRECWAESDTERFTLHYPINLLGEQ